MTHAPYDRAFYDEQLNGSLSSARVLLGRLSTWMRPESVLDIGCGRGAWLKAWHELGARTLHGVDGPWNDGRSMIEPSIRFSAADLEQPLVGLPRVDLAMSVEVVEHLSPQAGAALVDALVGASDVVLFSAAFSGQGGVHHVNERYHSHWGHMFRSHGFRCFDAFRPWAWSDARVAPWHRANVFLHVREGNALQSGLRDHGVAEIADLGFMDAVHPWLYERYREPGLRHHLRELLPGAWRALRRRRKR